MRRMIVALIAFGLLASGKAMAAESASVAKGELEVRFDGKTRTFEVSDKEAGPILGHGVIRAQVGGRKISSDDKNLTCRATADVDQGELKVEIGDALVLKIRLGDDAQVEARLEGKLGGPAVLQARPAAPHPMIAMVEEEREEDQGVLVTMLGLAEVPRARSLFYPDHDLAMTAGPADKARWTYADEGLSLSSEAPAGETLFSLKVHRHYYRDTLKIAHYAPITKRARWQTAPVVAMTWYGIEGWKGKPAQTKEWLYPNIDWVAKHLLPYAEQLVFQLDDNYYTDNDQYMRDISDYIRSKGLIPGIWFTPYTVAPKEVTEQHPDWFIHDKDGKPIPTFGGVSYRGDMTLNVTKPDAVKSWFGMWWRKASETWNFEFFKIDGQPQVIDTYGKATDGGGVEGYRKGLAIAREMVGPEKFINGCWGIPLGAIGRVDGSRTGGDTGNQAHAIDIVLRWNFLNNVCWWSDPDAAANLYKATVERARLNAQARVLTGQQFLTDDVWTSVPEAIRRVWQLSYPMLDIKPVNLYRIDDWKKYDLFDLRIAKPWGTWDVVGLFNYEGRPVVKTLDLARLPLEAEEVHVYEYWKGIYLGKFRHDAKIQRFLEAYEGELFRITPASKDGKPVLISTSRHASQGGLDLEDIQWTKQDDGWIAHGNSAHLVAGDPHEIVFATGKYFISVGGAEYYGAVARLNCMPERNGSLEWKAAFRPRGVAALEVTPTICDLYPDMKADIRLVSMGPKGLRWKAVVADPRLKVSPTGGILEAWPAETKTTVLVDALGLAPGQTWRGIISFVDEEGKGMDQRIEIRLRVPPPENLALRAKAKASSFWGRGYEANKVNDGDTATRWNAGRNEKQGCWIELDWGKPVTFSRVVIDEVMEFNGRIEAWKLEAGDEKREEIARGTAMGLRRTINLQKPVEARRLRLTIEKAIETPTIREIEIYEMSGGR